HLLLLEEEYLDEVRDQQEEKDLVNHYMHPPSKHSDTKSKTQNPPEFVVRDAPWSKPSPPTTPRPKPTPTHHPPPGLPLPDMADTEDFPAIGGNSNKPFATSVSWGPIRH
ncbi:hypothetical protein, partial [Salmonella sp. s54925]|uniref:hypothetical protein n=1 Tax=Salmonella sp. s54925 TaxID=3159674 RepID=UPI00398174AF